MIRRSLALVILLALGAAALGQNRAPESKGVPQPPPEEIAKYRRDKLAWERAATVEVYEKVGKKNAKWDAEARLALEAVAKYFSRPEYYMGQKEIAWEHADKAIRAGCDDPFIKYLFARLYPVGCQPSAADHLALVTEAAELLKKSEYPIFRKSFAHVVVANHLTNLKNRTAETDQKASQHLDAALALFPEVLKDTSSRGQKDSYGMGADLILFYHALLNPGDRTKGDRTKGDRKRAFDKVAPILEKSADNKAVWLLVKGQFYREYAWDGRGGEYADKVTPERWKLFEERIGEAEKALEAAWKEVAERQSLLKPTIATEMIMVEAGQGRGRERMELWFKRAMLADPDNSKACSAKIFYLEPKWHGSPKVLLEFGNECLQTENWESTVPIALTLAHTALSRYVPQTRIDEYWAQPAVWRDVQKVYEPYLKRDPQDRYRRSVYLHWAVKCQQYAGAQRQLDILGDNYSRLFYNAEEYEKAKAKVKEGMKQK
ncbi:hypothetical protein AYO44_04995 [Planctomycetaceae bacterium SCGC AG-212-F19]|nr:hypothetical protein AYO44_04995 [Planctomycetaceae bacterium SCGC AG-212-F19]